ncbi:MAG: hypothetical protein AMXMBFR33_42860 [Candidatus Xenobia bacterium]
MKPRDGLVRRAGRRSLVSFALTVSGMAVGLVMQALVARELGSAGYGVFGIILSALMVLSSLLPLGWFESTPKFVAEYREGQQHSLMWGLVTRSQQFCGLTTLVCSLGFLALEQIWRPDPNTAMVLLGIALLLPSYTLIRIQQQILLTLQHVRDGLVFVHLVSPTVVILGMVIWRNPGIDGVVTLYLVGNLVALLLQGLRLRRVLPGPPVREYRTRYWQKVASSLMAGLMGQRLINQGDVMMLSPFVGVSQVGIYALARRLVDVLAFANQALASAVAPMLGGAIVGKRYAQAHKLLWMGCLGSGLWALPFTLMGMFFPTEILSYFGNTFQGGELILQISLVGAFLNAASGPVGQALLIGGHEQFWRRSAAVTTVFGLTGCLVGAAMFGEIGIAVMRSLYIASISIWRLAYLNDSLSRSLRESEPSA